MMLMLVLVLMVGMMVMLILASSLRLVITLLWVDASIGQRVEQFENGQTKLAYAHYHVVASIIGLTNDLFLLLPIHHDV